MFPPTSALRTTKRLLLVAALALCVIGAVEVLQILYQRLEHPAPVSYGGDSADVPTVIYFYWVSGAAFFGLAYVGRKWDWVQLVLGISGVYLMLRGCNLGLPLFSSDLQSLALLDRRYASGFLSSGAAARKQLGLYLGTTVLIGFAAFVEFRTRLAADETLFPPEDSQEPARPGDAIPVEEE